MASIRLSKLKVAKRYHTGITKLYIGGISMTNSSMFSRL
jgi:hypothetical protein